MCTRPDCRKVLVALAAVGAVLYLTYRALSTFNLATPDGVFASVLLYAGEAFGGGVLLLYFVQVWEVREPPAGPAPEGRSVDVLVPACAEDVQILRATLEACVDIDYPHATYVLDDDGRPEVEALAEELGVVYVGRPDRDGSRAGSLNHALAQTSGEFVVVLDADHVPEPHFVTRLIGYFRDPKLAFVQTPHAYYNFDSFQSRHDPKSRRYWEEGQLFHQVIQPGRNRWGCPVFAGSGAMFRREALADSDGFAAGPAEDLETSVRLHGRGWKSLAITERLIAGRAAPDVATFHARRLARDEGNLRALGRGLPLTARGLSVPQRLCYLGSLLPSAAGPFRLVLYLTPVLMLFTGVAPVARFDGALAAAFLAYLLLTVAALKAAGNGFGRVVNAELFAMATFWTQTRAACRALFRRPNPAPPSASARGGPVENIWPHVRPQAYLILLGVLALAWAGQRLRSDLNPLSRADWFPELQGTALATPLLVGTGISEDYSRPAVPAVWLLLYLGLAYAVSRRAFWPADRRYAVRHVAHLPVEYEPPKSAPGEARPGVTVDLNDMGMCFVAYEVLPVGAVVRFTLRGAGEVIKCKGEIRSAAPLTRGGAVEGFRYGVAFRHLTPPQVHALNRLTLHYAVPRRYAEYERGNGDTLWRRVRNLAGRGMAQRRCAARYPYHLPLTVNPGPSEETALYSATEDLSRNATAAILDAELPPGTEVNYRMPTPLGEVSGTAKVLRTEPRAFAGRTFHRCVLEFRDFAGAGQATLLNLVNPRTSSPLSAALGPNHRPPTIRMRAPVLVGLLIAVPLLLAETGLFRLVHKDDLFLRDVASAPGSPTAEQVAEVERIYTATMARPRPSTDRLLLLLTALAKTNRDAFDQVWNRLCEEGRDRS